MSAFYSIYILHLLVALILLHNSNKHTHARARTHLHKNLRLRWCSFHKAASRYKVGVLFWLLPPYCPLALCAGAICVSLPGIGLFTVIKWEQRRLEDWALPPLEWRNIAPPAAVPRMCCDFCWDNMYPILLPEIGFPSLFTSAPAMYTLVECVQSSVILFMAPNLTVLGFILFSKISRVPF